MKSGYSEGQGTLACCSSCSRKDLYKPEGLSNNNNKSAWMCKAKYLIRQAVLWVLGAIFQWGSQLVSPGSTHTASGVSRDQEAIQGGLLLFRC